MKSKEAPGLQDLPSVVVLFRIASEPTETAQGVIEGWEAWWDDELFDTLMRRVRGEPTF
jgi:hypothetical protein